MVGLHPLSFSNFVSAHSAMFETGDACVRVCCVFQLSHVSSQLRLDASHSRLALYNFSGGDTVPPPQLPQLGYKHPLTVGGYLHTQLKYMVLRCMWWSGKYVSVLSCSCTVSDTVVIEHSSF